MFFEKVPHKPTSWGLEHLFQARKAREARKVPKSSARTVGCPAPPREKLYGGGGVAHVPLAGALRARICLGLT